MPLSESEELELLKLERERSQLSEGGAPSSGAGEGQPWTGGRPPSREEFQGEVKKFGEAGVRRLGEEIAGIPKAILGIPKAIGGAIADSPKALKTMATHPIEYGKGLGKGVLGAGYDALGMNKTSDLVEGRTTPRPKAFNLNNENQRLGAEFGGLAFGAASALVPGAKGASAALSGAGRATRKLGEAAYMQELGVLKPLAKKVAPTLNEAKKKISGTIEKYQLDSPSGFNSAAEKADALIDQKWRMADDLIAEYGRKNPTDLSDLSRIAQDLQDNVATQFRAGERGDAVRVVDKIVNELGDELIKDGVDPFRMTPEQLVKAKRSVDAKYNNFDRSAEPVKEAAYDAFQSSIIKRTNEMVPEAGKLNLEARDIWHARDALEEAAGRNNKLSNYIAMGAEAVPAFSAVMHDPAHALGIIGLTAGVDLTRRAAGKGRAASLTMRAGRGMEKLGKRINP
jgi:hypothetical protein